MFRERLYGYGVGVVAGLITVGAWFFPALAGWLALLVVLVWAARRRAPIDDRRMNDYGEVWHDD